MRSDHSFVCRAALAVCGVALLVIARADQMYVKDELVLNVYEEPDQGSARLATLATGDSVETLDRVDDFFLVRLADGVEGWVSASYLSAQAPAIVRVREIESQHKAATQKAQKAYKELEDQLSQVKARNEQLQEEAAQLAAQAAAAPEPVPEESSPAPDESQPRAERTGFNPALIWGPLVLIAGGLGYLLGHQVLAHRIRNKFGGVKIY